MTSPGITFEQKVVRVARALWGLPPGVAGRDVIEGQERDLTFEYDGTLYYIECTVSPKVEKLKHDFPKMLRLRNERTRQGKLVQLLYITQNEPTADQRKLARDAGIQILSLHDLRRRIFDVDAYLNAREAFPFGSATNPVTEAHASDAADAFDVSSVEYIAATLVHEASGHRQSAADIARLVAKGDQVLLLGDFGMGKSMVIREVFRTLQKNYYSESKAQRNARVPVALNLRMHWGQSDCAEALDRHAKALGLQRPHELIRLYNSPDIALILDGFDEIANMRPWALPKVEVAARRREAVSLVAEFASGIRGRGGLLVAGREHFFDSRQEMLQSLGLAGTHTHIFRVGEFDGKATREFLARFGIGEEMPEWLPRRPLFLATLAARGLLEGLGDLRHEDPAVAWDQLVDRICQREARIHKQLSAAVIRGTLERLASRARATGDGTGPLSEDDIARAFEAAAGALVDDISRPLLQRLPGLTIRDGLTGSRSFVDGQMLDALRAGDVVRFHDSPYTDPTASDWRTPIGNLGLGVAAQALRAHGEFGVTKAAAREAANRWSSPTLALDLVCLAQTMVSDGACDFDDLTIVGGDCDTLDFSEGSALTGLSLDTCVIGAVALPAVRGTQVSLRTCSIERVFGVPDKAGLPSWFLDCEVTTFDAAGTSAAIIDNEHLPRGFRCLLVILRKLFLQAGHGRQRGAFYRGVDSSWRSTVDAVLQVVRREGIAMPIQLRGNEVWLPLRESRERALAILAQGRQSADEAVVAASSIT